MKPRLTPEQANRMKWNDVMRYYWPDADDAFLDYLLWNETCYPHDDEKTLEQLYDIYLKQEEK